MEGGKSGQNFSSSDLYISWVNLHLKHWRYCSLLHLSYISDCFWLRLEQSFFIEMLQFVYIEHFLLEFLIFAFLPKQIKVFVFVLNNFHGSENCHIYIFYQEAPQLLKPNSYKKMWPVMPKRNHPQYEKCKIVLKILTIQCKLKKAGSQGRYI